MGKRALRPIKQNDTARSPLCMWPAASMALAALLAFVVPTRAQMGESMGFGMGGDMDAMRQQMMMLQQTGPGQTPNKPATEEEKKALAIVQQYLQMQPVRWTPGARIGALAERAAPKDGKEEAPSETAPAVKLASPAGSPPPEGVDAPDGEPPESAADPQGLRKNLVTGDWQAVREHLAELPEAVSRKVYTHILTMLGAKGQGILLPEDILLLADASPLPLADEQITALGALLIRSVKHVGKPHAFLAAVAKGTAQLGGEAPGQRVAAARLLVAAGLAEEAGAFLPPLDEALSGKDAVLIDLHARREYALGQAGGGKPAFGQAWYLTTTVLDLPETAETLRSTALARMLQLLPIAPEAPVSTWLRKAFAGEPASALRVLAQALVRLEACAAQKPYASRLSALKPVHRLANELLATGEEAHWQPVLKMLTLPYLGEAQYSVSGKGGVAIDPSQFPPGYTMEQMQRMMGQQRRGRQPIPVAELLPLCPSQRWCAAVGGDLSRQMSRLKGTIAAAAADREETLSALRQFVTDDPDLAKQLAGKCIEAWAKQLRPTNQRDQRYGRFGGTVGGMGMGMGGGYYPGTERAGVSLTRAKQVRNLAAFRELLGEIREIGVATPAPGILISTFDACHSPAEVYRKEDVESVLGSLESISSEIAVALASTARGKLAGQWRRPDQQEKSGTRRTDRQLVAEVKRGYELALALATNAAEKRPENAQYVVILASVYFDQAEFMYGLKADLETYGSLRDEAFLTYRKAAALYAKQLATAEPGSESVATYLQWYRSALGASDLAYLTRQDRPDRDQTDLIESAIRNLGGDVADRHLTLFGEAVVQSMGQVPAQLRPHYLREAVRILGEHPSGSKARERLQYYDDLLAEVQLHVEIDGRAEVGHGIGFGAHLSVRATSSLSRESGGFGRLLSKQYSRQTGQQVDRKEGLEKNIREKLGEAFEVDVLRFHDSNVTPRGFGRPGWRETPLAYLVMRCKDPSVDRLPVLHVDMQFNDGGSSVLLPIKSQTVLIDARDAAPEERPCEALKVRQTLDDRQLTEGTVRLEILATGKGLIPELDQLLVVADGAVPGFALASVEDLGLEVDSLDTTGDAVRPVCQRRWLVGLKPVAGEFVAELSFPKARDDAVELTYQRYDDADIVDTGPVAPLRTSVRPDRRWGVAAGRAVLLGIIVVLVAIRLRRRVGADEVSPVYHRPDPLTPFNGLALLKQLHADQTLRLSAGQRQELEAEIHDLERCFFEVDGQTEQAPDLVTSLNRWLAAAT